MANILVTGARGQLGTSLLLSADTTHNYIWADRALLDITDTARIRELIHSEQIDLVIHAAAYTAVDRAESQAELCHRINATATRHIAAACSASDAALLYISSDYVYDNGLLRPLQTTDPTTPRSVYGQSKLSGEWYALSECERTTILRSSWLWTHDFPSFYKAIVSRLRAGRSLEVVDDQLGCPTYVPHLAEQIHAYIDSNHWRAPASWIYNYCDEGAVSWYAFAQEIASSISLDPAIIRSTTTAAYGAPAPRPRYSVLDATPWTQITRVPQADWRAGL